MTPRRVSVKKHPGIYYRETPQGRRYEISYVDSTGTRRWKVVDGGLREADAARDAIRDRLRRGERVAPTRATFAEVAEQWFAAQTQLRPRTRERYEAVIRCHLVPRLGRLRIGEVTVDHVSDVVVDLQRQGRSGWTSHGVLVVLGNVMGHAVRRGMIASNPVAGLQKGERPKVGRRDQRVLDRDEIEKLLDAAEPKWRPLLACAVFTGARQSELLGLVWGDVDLDAGVVRIRRQLERGTGARVEPKTPTAKRDVVFPPSLARILREHKLASPHSGDGDFVFASACGTPVYYRNAIRRGLEPAVERAGLNSGDRPRLRFHDLRHTYASLLIASGADVVYVSRQLGHASPTVTLGTYSHLFDAARHGDRMREMLERGFGGLLDGVAVGTDLEQTGGDQRRIAAAGGGPDLVDLSRFRD